MRENQKRRHYDYVINQKVLKKRWRPTKLGERTTGPYKVLQVHANNTFTIELKEEVTERLNIQRVIPYKE
jgi:hypothetical protein